MLFVVTLYGLAMALMPFGHRPLNLPTGPDLSEYALPDGTLPVLCATTPGKPGQPASRSGVICDACLLTSAPGLVVAGLVLPPAPQSVPVRLGRALETQSVPQKYTTAARPRAPPRSLA